MANRQLPNGSAQPHRPRAIETNNVPTTNPVTHIETCWKAGNIMSDSWWLKDARWVAIRKWYKDNTPAGGWTCHLCNELINPNVSGRTRFGLSIDHIVPVSRGGALFDLANTAPAHGKCNSGKREGRNLAGTVAAPYQAPFRRRARRAPGTTPKAKAVATQPIPVEPVGPDDVTGSQIW